MKPLARAAALLPPVALRADPLVGITAGARYLLSLLQAFHPPSGERSRLSTYLQAIVHCAKDLAKIHLLINLSRRISIAKS